MRESLDGGAIGDKIAFLHRPSISESLPNSNITVNHPTGVYWSIDKPALQAWWSNQDLLWSDLAATRHGLHQDNIASLEILERCTKGMPFLPTGPFVGDTTEHNKTTSTPSSGGKDFSTFTVLE
jgi:hypothetical protein